jgi:hypothetical protein
MTANKDYIGVIHKKNYFFFIGEIKNNMANGNGFVKFYDGREFNGNFIKNKANGGDYILKFESNMSFQGTWKEGQPLAG